MSSATSQTALEQNKHLLIRWFDEVWNQGRNETIHELLAPECVIHDGSKAYRGPAEFMAFHTPFARSFRTSTSSPLW